MATIRVLAYASGWYCKAFTLRARPERGRDRDNTYPEDYNRRDCGNPGQNNNGPPQVGLGRSGRFSRFPPKIEHRSANE